jgi:hypothetical protein
MNFKNYIQTGSAKSNNHTLHGLRCCLGPFIVKVLNVLTASDCSKGQVDGKWLQIIRLLRSILKGSHIDWVPHPDQMTFKNSFQSGYAESSDHTL